VWRLQRPHHHERHRFEPTAHLVGRVATPLTDAGMQDLTPFVSAMPGGMDMTTLTIRLPEDTAQRLKLLARRRGLSTNKLVEDLSARALAAWDTENHFRAMAATGDINQALAILDRLDSEDHRAGC
ncbi:CopG family transcriptional regulator, partial [Rhodoferax sp.]|uniref:ribbon-helix-helix domain-containing protein n=2 Tax=Rhodoferax sp. TaxID=50421 RepID=UPI003BB59B2F